MNAKVPYPFMTFAEQVPEAAQLLDPTTSADEKELILWKIEDDIEIVRSIADRDTQRDRHAANHAERTRVMNDLRLDARGKPERGEPSRLAAAHGVRVAKIRKWVEQLRQATPKGAEAVADDWRTVCYGQMLRKQRSVAGGQRGKLAKI
jgi:hypothetical protein